MSREANKPCAVCGKLLWPTTKRRYDGVPQTCNDCRRKGLAAAGDDVTVAALFCDLRDAAVERGDHVYARLANELAIKSAGQIEHDAKVLRDLDFCPGVEVIDARWLGEDE